MRDLDDPITLQLLWNRLVFITDQADIALGRTAFSSVIRESHDYVTVLLDTEGNSLAQCSQSIPAFIGSLPLAAKEFLKRYPVSALEPGDVLFTNDPAIGTGHLNDGVMIAPVYRRGRPVALVGNIAHMSDVGGRPHGPDATDLYEEGIRLPILKLYKAGRPNQDVLDVLAASVRMPREVMGDLQSQLAANDVMARELAAFMDEYAIDDLAPLARVIHARSERAMRAAIRTMPAGVYAAEARLDGFDAELRLKVTVTVGDDSVHVDYAGSSPQVPWGINVMPNYRYAHSAYAIKCLLDPETPNNEGCIRPITDAAPLGSLFNPRHPAACNARNLVGHVIPSVIFRALEHVVPERVQADSGGAPLWVVNCVAHEADGRPIVGVQAFHGGQGGRASGDGNDTLSFPSNCSTTPVEMFERAVPVLIEAKHLIADSGGPGRFRGGLGQRMVVRNVSGRLMHVYLGSERVTHPPFGVAGGRAGRAGRVLRDDAPVFPKGKIALAPDQRLIVESPGGGGWGDPATRPRDLVARDVREGLVTAAAAESDYGGITDHAH
ncbi:MAG TPA: hydantoinase B/oxoprolinase family protein [Methylomirabilota bacterium]|nr:hydantoinase B/oxoprolinase family protein [Methylomirabilota bacterium]